MRMRIISILEIGRPEKYIVQKDFNIAKKSIIRRLFFVLRHDRDFFESKHQNDFIRSEIDYNVFLRIYKLR